MKLHADAGKTPAHVKKDVPGFIGNRLLHALWREAIYLVQEGIASPEDHRDLGLARLSTFGLLAASGRSRTWTWSAPT